MKYFGLLYVVIGIFLGFMAYKNNNKISLHMRYKEILVIEELKYFELQKLFGIVGSFIVLLSGIIFYFEFDRIGVSLVLVLVLSSMLFNILNFILFKVALKRNLIRKANL